jgi:peptidoglycan/LPS O-acetylase OafA/YrhL
VAQTAISYPLPASDRLVSLPRSQTKSTERFYRPELDALRFLAFVAVFLHHSLPGFELSRHAGRLVSVLWLENLLKDSGSFGVCLFFLLSAYLITELLQRERERTGAVNVRSFYLRRMLRIWPLYFLFIFCGVLLGTIFHPYRIEGARIWAFLLMVGNWYVASVSCGASPIAPLWSISLEEQFYLVWPWVAKYAKREIVFWGSLLLIPVSWLALIRLAHPGTSADRTIWVNTFVQFQFFGLGAFLALALKGRTPRLGTAARLSLILGGIAVWLAAQGLYRIKGEGPVPHALPFILGYTMVATGCVLLFVGFLGMPQQWVPRKLAYLGKISYGLYVFHMVAFDLAWKALAPSNTTSFGSTGGGFGTVTRYLLMQILAFIVTILLAMASYRFFEQPFLKLKERFALVKSRAI